MNEDAGTPGEQPEEERMVPLSPRQQDLYDFIRGYIARAGIAPSRGEISVALGTRSPSAGEQHLAALKKKGWIEIIPNTQRGIVLIGTGQVPLLYVDGHIGRQTPLDPMQDAVDRIPGALANRFQPRPDFCLELGPYGMDVAGCRNGEIVAVSTEKIPRDFDVVIARVGGFLQCRVLRRVDEGTVELIDVDRKNAMFVNRINLSNHTFRIEGVVVGSILGHPLQVSPWYSKVTAKLKDEAAQGDGPGSEKRS